MNESETKPNNQSTTPESYQQQFLYDAEKLRDLTSDNNIKQGLIYFKENRVFDMDTDNNRLWAYVEGSKKNDPYYVELTYLDDTTLHVSCTCTSSAEAVCKHAIALLYQYSEKTSGTNQELQSAQLLAISDRVNRGRREVKVKHLSGQPWFGEWQASSIVSTTHRPQTYKVHIRSITERSNYCTCPDHATNLLGTCKHIEAVLNNIEKNKAIQGSNEKGLIPVVYLAWDVENAPKIRLQRTATNDRELAALLNANFDAQGDFKGQLPDDFFRFSDLVDGRSDVLVGEDARLYCRTIAADASHAVRAAEIEQQIMRSNGILPGIKTRLYPYQVEGVAFLAATGRSLLADDMGLGKTIQAIAAASWLQRHVNINKTLIICPASLKHQWAREIEKFTDQKAQIIQGDPSMRHAQYRKNTAFFVINYELVLRDLSLINDIVRPDLLILDEAQRIKNWKTKIASTIKLISSRYAFVLTGTPLENRLEDLYSLLQVVNPRILGPLWRYMTDFHITDEYNKVLGYRNLSELRRRIAPVMLRRERSLVRDQLPDCIQTRLDIPMTEQQIELHNAALSAASSLAHVSKRRPLTPSEQHRLMAALQQARMACDAAGLVDKETIGSPKLDEMANLLEDICLQNGLKVVIFSQWERMTAMAEQVIKRLNIGFVRLHGGVPTAKRGDLLDRFRNDDSISIFLSTDAGGTGLNLQSAAVVINLDVPWNPAILAQRNARVHRLGQENKVQIIVMVAENSYEEKVLSLLKSKQNLFDNAIAPDATEDVVGINKKMLETLVEDLTDEPVTRANSASLDDNPEPSSPETTDEAQVTKCSTLDTHSTEQDKLVQHCILKIQETFGRRLERILGAQGGLLVVLSIVENDDEQVALELSTTLPIALIDLRTLNGLQRLGKASPIGETQLLFNATDDALTPVVSPFTKLANEKLKAAEMLIEQKCEASATELLASAMLAAIASRTDRTAMPAADEIMVWLYTDVVPKGIITPTQANAALRAHALKYATNIPESLVFEVLQDTRLLLAEAHIPQ